MDAFWECLRLRLKMNAEQRQFAASRRLSGARPADDWLAIMLPVSRFDALADAARPQSYVLIAVGVLSVALVGGGDAVLYSMGYDWPLEILTIPLGLLTVGAVAAAMYLIARDSANSLRSLVIPLFCVLREEAKHGRDIELNLDVLGVSHKDKESSAELVPYERNGYTFNRFHWTYDDPWLTLAAPMADGSQLGINIAERTFTKGKRNKYKVRTELDVRLRMPVAAYGMDDVLLPDATRASQGEKWLTFRVRRKHKWLYSMRYGDEDRCNGDYISQHAVPVDLVLEMLASIYEHVRNPKAEFGDSNDN